MIDSRGLYGYSSKHIIKRWFREYFPSLGSVSMKKVDAFATLLSSHLPQKLDISKLTLEEARKIRESDKTSSNVTQNKTVVDNDCGWNVEMLSTFTPESKPKIVSEKVVEKNGSK